MTVAHPPTSRPMPRVPGVRHRLVDVGGVRLHVAEAGSGSPVLLLHDFPQHWYAWRAVIPPLAARHRVICPDWRGFGWSQAPRRGYDTRSRAADVPALLDALGLRGATVVGHGLGGWAAFHAAARFPERITALLVLGIAHPWARQRDLLADAWRYWITVPHEYPGVGRTVLRRAPWFTRHLLRRATGAGYRWDEAALAEFVAASRLPGAARAGEQLYWQYVRHDIPGLVGGRTRRLDLPVPTRMLLGTEDPVISVRAAAAPAPGAAELSLRTLDGCGHLLPEECPEAVVAEILELAGRRVAGTV